MSENAIDSSKATPASAAAEPKRKPAEKAKPAKKAGRAKKVAAKPKGDRTNKKAQVIAMMKRAKGATLPEIVKATGWQPHTAASWVAREGRRSSRPRTPRENGRTRSGNNDRQLVVQTPPRQRARPAFLLVKIGFETLKARRPVSERVSLGQGRSSNRRNRCT
jgi:hypothetical protein